jgi:hypothetical protein
VIRSLLITAICICSAPCHAGDVDDLFGQYTYEEYSFKWPTGQTTGFKELGASGAILEINSDMSITLTMHMLDGTDHASRAEILELHLEGDTGYLVAKWPDMTYAVRKDFTLQGNILRYVIYFNEPRDSFRYGGIDQGVLRRMPESSEVTAPSPSSPAVTNPASYDLPHATEVLPASQ